MTEIRIILTKDFYLNSLSSTLKINEDTLLKIISSLHMSHKNKNLVIFSEIIKSNLD